MSANQPSSHDLYTVTQQITSMVMYIEAAILAGMSFDEARQRAIDNATFVGPTARYRKEIETIIKGVGYANLSSIVRQTMNECMYLVAIATLKKRDTPIRRCAYRWFGLLI